MLNALGNCTLNWIRFLQVASCLLVGKGIISSRNGCVVKACDNRRTRSIGRWQFEWLGNQLVGLGWVSHCTFFLERQYSWHVISVHKTPLYFPASTRLSHTLQVCYWTLVVKRSNRTYCKPEFPFSLSFLRSLSYRAVRCVEMGWHILLIRHLLKCPTLPFVPPCNLRVGHGILLYSYVPTIHKGVAQSHSLILNDKWVQNSRQYRLTSYSASRLHIST